jgi:hypothetical protein
MFTAKLNTLRCDPIANRLGIFCPTCFFVMTFNRDCFMAKFCHCKQFTGSFNFNTVNCITLRKNSLKNVCMAKLINTLTSLLKIATKSSQKGSVLIY